MRPAPPWLIPAPPRRTSGAGASPRPPPPIQLESPAWLSSTSLNRAVFLYWSDNPFQNAQSAFQAYRVYSTPYSLDQNLCDSQWVEEGTTISPEFIVSELVNGTSRCFRISAVRGDGAGSQGSPIGEETPRPAAGSFTHPTQAAGGAR